jgi:hypothetical protein
MKTISTSIALRLNLVSVSEFFAKRGYVIHEQNDSSLHLSKPGTTFTTSLKRIPLELSFLVSDNQTDVSLAYGALVLFDTGDLKKETDRITEQIDQFRDELV